MTERMRFPAFRPTPGRAPSALGGVRVVDFSRMLAGPFCTQSLGDLGADVIKIESPEGDDFRNFSPPALGGEGAFYLSTNRNKRSITLDLKNEEGQRRARQLIARADVLVENFSNGVMERLGLGYATVSADNPGLVYCSISGYGRDDASAVPRRAYDTAIQAVSGFMSLTGEADRPPMRTTIPVIDAASALFATNAVLAALIARQSLGRGQFVEIALIDVAYAMLNMYGMAYLASGEEPVRSGNRAPLSNPSDVYATSDGAIFLSASNERMYRRLVVEGLNRPDLFDDPDLRTNGARCVNHEKLTRAFSDVLRAHSTDYWVERLSAVGASVAPVRTLAQAMRAPEVLDRALINEIPHPTAGSIPNIRSPYKFGMTPVADPVAAPLLGQHTSEILQELGSTTPGSECCPSGAPLDCGMRDEFPSSVTETDYRHSSANQRPKEQRLIDYASLVGFELPEIRQTLTPTDSIIYALSVGLGQDATDERQLDFVDHHRKLCVLPSLGFILGHPGVWVSAPALNFDLSKVLNAQQAVTIHRPLRAAERVRSRLRIVGVVDKGPGKAVLIYTERGVWDSDDGELIATVEGTTYLRGEGGFGGPNGPVKYLPAVPDRAPDWIEEFQTRPEQALLYRLSGDDNPMHSDPALARQAGFAKPILHGLCTLGFACHAVVKVLCQYEVQRLRRFGGRFTAPIYPGETIRVEIWRDGAFRVRSVDRRSLAIDFGHADII